MAKDDEVPASASVQAPIGGTCDSRFEGVRDAFRENFAIRHEIGAALCIRLDGHVVVDLWGGFADLETQSPWRGDTLANVYSIGKGVLATLSLAVIESGRAELDVPVARYWPEFGAFGKDRVTLRTLLAHRAGLPGVRERLPEGAMLDWDVMCAALATQQPYWEPDTLHGYHVNTFGFLVGEALRRQAGASVTELLREFVTGPLEAEFFWGLPESYDTRVATTYGPGANLVMKDLSKAAQVFPSRDDPDIDEMIAHVYFNPSGISGMGVVNQPGWRRAAIPSTNGQGTARAVAAIYAGVIGHADTSALVGAELCAEGARVHSHGPDHVLGRESTFGLGFQLSTSGRPLGPNPGGFGHYGYGGSLGFVDPGARLAFGYVMNNPGQRWQTPRTQALIDAVYTALG